MISDENLTKISYEMSNAFEEINQEYIAKMCEHLKTIGELTPTDVHILEQLELMNANIKEINLTIQKQCNISTRQLNTIYQRCGLEAYKDMSIFYKFRNIKQTPFRKNNRMQNLVGSVSQLTANAFTNLSRTTVVSKSYKKAVDKAIYAITSGVSDYQSYMRRTINKISSEGLKVKYDSGLERRLDSAVRMNVLEGARQVAQGVRMISGEEFGADGVQVDAHGLCAPDHILIQGKRMSMTRFKKENEALKRPIGTCNCKHSYSPIILGVSVDKYSKDDLQKMKDYSNEIVEIDGKKMTRYEASQVMRRLETNVRKQKDVLIGAQSFGDKKDIAATKKKIAAYKSKYAEVSKASQLAQRPSRMSVPSRTQGYRNRAIKDYLNNKK